MDIDDVAMCRNIIRVFFIRGGGGGWDWSPIGFRRAFLSCTLSFVDLLEMQTNPNQISLVSSRFMHTWKPTFHYTHLCISTGSEVKSKQTTLSVSLGRLSNGSSILTLIHWSYTVPVPLTKSVSKSRGALKWASGLVRLISMGFATR